MNGPEDKGPSYWHVIGFLTVFSIVVPWLVGLLAAFAKAWQ